MATNLAIKMQGIVKEFPGVLANNNVDLEIQRGEIHGLIGENGAGKSTLMNILYGLYQADTGSIEVYGEPVHIGNPHEAINLGIGMVHQHFMLVPSLTVLDNIILGKTPTRLGLTDYRASRHQVETVIEQYGFNIDLDVPIHSISVGQMQRVEIVKALYRGAKILILDEPTAVLTPQESDELFKIMREMSSQGCSIILITHKLKEVMAVSDRITVMRRGEVTGRVETKDVDVSTLAEMMVGRDVVLKVEKDAATPADDVLKLERVSAIGSRNIPCLLGVDLQVRKGEIVGIAGVEGNGQTELIEVITGLRPVSSGNVYLAGKDITKESILSRRRLGIAHIPEDRINVGVCEDRSIEENMIACNYFTPELSSHGVINKKAITDYTASLVDEFGIKVASTKDHIATLSGGNMQKVVIARELSSDPLLIVAGQPTRGVDVGAIEFIHKQLIRLRDNGTGILLVSADIDETLALSDRVYVMYEGELVANFVNDNLSDVELGLYMTGAKRASAVDLEKDSQSVSE